MKPWLDRGGNVDKDLRWYRPKKDSSELGGNIDAADALRLECNRDCDGKGAHGGGEGAGGEMMRRCGSGSGCGCGSGSVRGGRWEGVGVGVREDVGGGAYFGPRHFLPKLVI